MEKDPKVEEFEYNDGLGDMLREKEQREFSWTKTSTTVVVIVIVVILSFFLGFNMIKKMMSKGADTTVAIPELSKADVQANVDKMEEENSKLINKIQEELANRKETPAISKPMMKKPVVKEPEVKKQAPVKVNSIKVNEVVKEPTPKKSTPVIVKEMPKDPYLENLETMKPVFTKKVPVEKMDDGMALPYKVIAGSFKSKQNAINYKATLIKQGMDAFVWGQDIKGVKWYRVQVGAFKDYKTAKLRMENMKTKGYSVYVLKK